ncbi:MAG: hypothetical protein LBK54_06650 [Propionibacteriaceae bacterium]|jgi:hypothetical protein|nr:hypothetical protein [Propionibacteriaceae bacterium]
MDLTVRQIVDRVCDAIRSQKLKGYRASIFRAVWSAPELGGVDLAGVDRWAVVDSATSRGVAEGWLEVVDCGEPFYVRPPDRGA